MRRAALLATVVSALACASAHAARPPVPGGGGGHGCDAIVVNGTPAGEIRSIVVISGISAITHARRYGTSAALWTSVRGIGCDAARRFLATVLLAPDERVALELAAGA